MLWNLWTFLFFADCPWHKAWDETRGRNIECEDSLRCWRTVCCICGYSWFFWSCCCCEGRLLFITEVIWVCLVEGFSLSFFLFFSGTFIFFKFRFLHLGLRQEFLMEEPYTAEDIEKITEQSLETIFAASPTSLDVLRAAKNFKLHQVCPHNTPHKKWHSTGWL